jgi:hypothetical protein
MKRFFHALIPAVIMMVCGCAVIGTVTAVTPEENAGNLPVFNVTLISGEETATAIAITLEKSADTPAGAIPVSNLQFNLTDPEGTGQDVALCSSLDPALSIEPGKPFYIIKRSKPVFYIVDETDTGGCGGGGGGGSGSQQASNKNFSPKGTWKIEIFNATDTRSIGNWTFTV